MTTRIAIISTFIIFWSFSIFANSTGGLVVTPTRIVFEDRDRIKEVYLINQDTQTMRYRINFINLSMQEDGSYQKVSKDGVEEQGIYPVGPHIRYSPRQVTLGPGEQQIVRLMARRYGMKTGEYRSHLFVTPIPNTNNNHI
ncbi:MAG: hypothetical protein HRT90_11070, partial [Candidatus Margulisbacteria bacterium]|nr:hypothetical protein [Candidatus Margulisiibacteriota bacterium]